MIQQSINKIKSNLNNINHLKNKIFIGLKTEIEKLRRCNIIVFPIAFRYSFSHAN